MDNKAEKIKIRKLSKKNTVSHTSATESLNKPLEMPLLVMNDSKADE